MKAKIYALAILLLVLSHGSLSQGSIRIGLKAGLNFPRFKPSVIPAPIQKVRDDNGFYAGARLEWIFNKHFGLQTEILYIDSRVQDLNNAQYLMTEMVSHISAPMLAKVKLGHLGIFAGPQFSYLQSANTKYQDYSGMYPEQKTRDVTDSSYKKFNLSGVVGVEYTIGYNFGFDVRYQFGFSNIRAANGTTLLTKKDGQVIHLNGFQAGIFVRFGNRPKK